MASNATDNVTYTISIQAAEAVQQLEALNAQTSSWDAKITAVTAKVQELSASWGTSFRSTIGVLKNADAEMQQASNSAGVFGQQITNSATGATKSLSNIGFAQVAKEAEDATPRVVRGIDAIRIALGALTAMLVFNVVQAFQNFFSTAIKNAYDLQGALYNVANAERIMSQQGIDIAPKDLDKMIFNLQKLVPIMSQIDATKAVSSLALFTKDLGYTKDQISSLSDAVGVLYVRNKAMGLSFEQVLSQVQTGLLTGRAQGIRDLGVSISEAAIQQEALRMGLVKNEKEFKNLTGDTMTQVKAQAMLSIIVRNTAEEQKTLGQYMDTNAGKIDKFNASWSNLTTTIGHIFLPVIGTAAGIMNIFVSNTVKDLENLKVAVAAVTAFIIARFVVMGEVLQGHITSVPQLIKAYNDAYSAINANLTKAFDNLGGLKDAQDTATSSAKNLTDTLVDMSKIDLSSMQNSLIGLGERLDNLNRDFSQANANYIAEQNTKMSRMQQDYQIEVAKTIQGFNDQRASAEQKYRNNQLDAEAKFQERMRELRAKYLFDLEDALRNRDARQVLRLQAQYQMDKTNEENRFKLEQANAARQQKQELADIKKQEAEKLAELAQAEAIKEQRAVEDFNREQAQRLQKYNNEKADLAQQIDDVLRQEADKIAKEYGINQAGADSIYNLLKKYYGPAGLFDGLYTYSYNSLVGKAAGMLATLQGIIGQYMGAMATVPGMAPMVGSTNTEPYRGGGGTTATPATNTPAPSGGGMQPFHGMAEGGVNLAKAPTTVTYAEKEPEMAIFLPLSKLMAGMSNIPVTTTGGEGASSMNGVIKLLLELSPDLVARVTENTLEGAAKVITQVYRSRQ